MWEGRSQSEKPQGSSEPHTNEDLKVPQHFRERACPASTTPAPVSRYSCGRVCFCPRPTCIVGVRALAFTPHRPLGLCMYLHLRVCACFLLLQLSKL